MNWFRFDLTGTGTVALSSSKSDITIKTEIIVCAKDEKEATEKAKAALHHGIYIGSIEQQNTPRLTWTLNSIHNMDLSTVKYPDTPFDVFQEDEAGIEDEE